MPWPTVFLDYSFLDSRFRNHWGTGRSAGKAPGDGDAGCRSCISLGRAMATGTVGADAPTVGGTEVC